MCTALYKYQHNASWTVVYDNHEYWRKKTKQKEREKGDKWVKNGKGNTTKESSSPAKAKINSKRHEPEYLNKPYLEKRQSLWKRIASNHKYFNLIHYTVLKSKYKPIF